MQDDLSARELLDQAADLSRRAEKLFDDVERLTAEILAVMFEARRVAGLPEFSEP